MSKEIALKSYDIAKPDQVASMATSLKSHVVKHNLYTNIKGKNYVHVEGWQFAGSLMGTFPRIVAVQKLEKGLWQAEAEIVEMKTDRIISRGFAICSKDEGAGTKSSKEKNDEYAILSMAQTRAIGKAYRNVVGWVMKLAGYEGTPAEEMKSSNKNDSELQKALQFIENAKTKKILFNALERVQTSDNFSTDEKKELESKISARIDSLDEAKK